VTSNLKWRMHMRSTLAFLLWIPRRNRTRDITDVFQLLPEGVTQLRFKIGTSKRGRGALCGLSANQAAHKKVGPGNSGDTILIQVRPFQHRPGFALRKNVS